MSKPSPRLPAPSHKPASRSFLSVLFRMCAGCLGVFGALTTMGQATAQPPSQPAQSFTPVDSAPPASANFRVHSRVFFQDQSEPISENLTLFSSGVIYNFLYSQPETVTIVDLQRGRIILLDVQRKVRTGISTETLLDLNARMKAATPAEKMDSVAPELTESLDADAMRLVLTGKLMRYEATGESATASRAKIYRQFTDWIARLNAVRPGGKPPFARLTLNRGLARQNWIPKEVQLFQNDKPFARSEHLVNWQLIGTDRERIDRAGQYMAEFKAITFKQYIGQPAGDND